MTEYCQFGPPRQCRRIFIIDQTHLTNIFHLISNYLVACACICRCNLSSCLRTSSESSNIDLNSLLLECFRLRRSRSGLDNNFFSFSSICWYSSCQSWPALKETSRASARDSTRGLAESKCILCLWWSSKTCCILILLAMIISLWLFCAHNHNLDISKP